MESRRGSVKCLAINTMASTFIATAMIIKITDLKAKAKAKGEKPKEGLTFHQEEQRDDEEDSNCENK